MKISKNKKQLKHLASIRGKERELYFKEGGELCRWRGLGFVSKDKKKHANKKACRKKYRG